MRLLVFEYSTCTNMDNLLSEGINMLKCILNDLDSIEEYDVDYLINHSINIDGFSNCTPIKLYDDLTYWLNENVKSYDYVLFIAPEDDYIQYQLTKVIEGYDVEIIGSNSRTSRVCSSKHQSYRHVNDNIMKIPSLYFNTDNVNIDLIKKNLSDNLIIKPDTKTSSDYIYHIKDIGQINEIMKIYKKNKIDNCIIQEYISGRCVSTSSICNKKNIQILSINSQEMKEEKNQIRYMGCRSPINDEKEEELYRLTEKILKEIPGLRGFIGIDYIINEDNVYFVEINTRITTPFIILSRNCNKNLTRYLIEYVIHDHYDEITFSKEGMFFKGDKK